MAIPKPQANARTIFPKVNLSSQLGYNIFICLLFQVKKIDLTPIRFGVNVGRCAERGKEVLDNYEDWPDIAK
jgi:hypothetical protein